MKPYIFVEFSKGTYEGHDYNTVTLSNGIRAGKIKNLSGQDDFLASLKEGDEVNADIEIIFAKNDVIQARLNKIEKRIKAK